MGVYFMQRELKKKYGDYAQQIKMRVKAMKGGMSGGTYASLSYVMEEAAQDKSIFKTLFDPYGLDPADSPRGHDKPDLRKVIYDKDAKSWIAPFIMAAINTKVTGEGVGGRLKGLATAAALGVLMGGKPGSILKKVTDKVLPDPGEGPNKKERENGFYNLRFLGKMADGTMHLAKVTGDRDPGYGSTSKMLSEAAICLALDKDKCPKVAGMLSPATALGDPYLERLQTKAGLTFDLLSDT